MMSPFSNKTVLITGAAGFLGRHIIRSLPDDCQIIAVDNQITGGEFVDQSNVHNSTADITNDFVRIGLVSTTLYLSCGWDRFAGVLSKIPT